MITALIDALVGILKALFSIMGEFGQLLYDLISQNTKPGYHDVMASSWSFLSRWNKGFSVNGSHTGKITEQISNRHLAIIGPSGAGKTTTTILASIFLFINRGLGIVVNDISGEIHEKTSGFANQMGIKILVFDTEHPETSDYFNPLAYANNSAQISHIAHLLIKSSLAGSGSPNDVFWNESASMLLYIIISMQKELPERFQNLYNTRYLLNQITVGGKDATILDHLFSRTKNQALYEEYKALVYGSDTKLLANVVSTCKASLRVLSDENVAILTSKNTIDFNELRKGNTIIYLKVPGLAAERLRPITSLLIETCFGTLMSRLPNPQTDKPVAFILDEVSSMTLSLESILATSRKYMLWVLYALQHPSQLDMNYGKHQAKSILQNTYTKLYLPGQEQDVAQHLQASLGHRDFIDPDNKSKRTMPLRTARQLQKMPKNQALVFVGNDAFETKLRPYYKQRKFRQYSEITEAHREPQAVSLPPLITLNDLEEYEQSGTTKEMA